MSPHSDTLSYFQANQSLLLQIKAACLAEKQQILILYILVLPNQGSNSRSTTLEVSTLTITALEVSTLTITALKVSTLTITALKVSTLTIKLPMWCDLTRWLYSVNNIYCSHKNITNNKNHNKAQFA